MVLCLFRCCSVVCSSEDELRDRLAYQSIHGSDIVDTEAILDSIQPLNSMMDEDVLVAVTSTPQRSVARVRVNLRSERRSVQRTCVLS